MKTVSRFLALLLTLVALATVACGSSDSATTPSDVAAQTEERVLKVAMTFLDEPPDPYHAGWLAVPTGLAETLFRLGDNLKPEPWLAPESTQVAPT